MKFLNAYFLQPPVPPSLFEPNTLLSILLCNSLYQCSSLCVTDRVPHSCKTVQVNLYTITTLCTIMNHGTENAYKKHT